MYWKESNRFHRPSVALADRHYNRQKIGSNQFVPPGKPIVLLGLENNAVWVTLEQKPEFQDHEWKGAWTNTIFRNESDELSSDLIIQACGVTRAYWGANPEGIITMIGTKKVRWKKDFGYCYKMAGFVEVGYTKVNKLLVLKLFPEKFPPSQLERKFRRRQVQILTQEANTFYAALSKTPYEVGLETAVNVRRANLLTGLKTHARNLISNVGFGISEEATRPLAWMMDVAVSGKTGQRTVQGISPKAIAQSFVVVVKQDETFKNIDKASGAQMAMDILRYGDSFSNLEKQQHSESNVKWIGAYTNGVFRTLGAEDALFKVYAFRRSLEEQANVIARTERRSDRNIDIKQRRDELLKTPTQVMIQLADSYADFCTFQNDNLISRKLTQVKNLSPTGKAIIETIVPYDRTPTNIVLRVLEHTPVGLLKMAKIAQNRIRPTEKKLQAFNNKFRAAVESDIDTSANAQEFADLPATKRREIINEGLRNLFNREQQREFSLTFGRAGVGSSIFGLGVMLAAAGLLTGSMSPDDDGDREEKGEFFGRLKAGIENRSLLIPGYGRFVLPDTPILKVLTYGATFYEQSKAGKRDSTLNIISGAAESFGEMVMEQPLLDNSSDLYRTVKKAKFGEFTGNLLGGYIPTLISDIGEVSDEKARTSSGYLKDQKVNTFSDWMRQQGRGFRNSFTKRLPIVRNYAAAESDSTVSQKERGDVYRRMVRMVDILNTRSPVPYNQYVSPAYRQDGK